MKNKTVPTEELDQLLCMLGANCGGLLTKEQVLDQLTLSDVSFEYLEREYKFSVKEINDTTYYRGDDIDALPRYVH
jgi:hypothetical protein